MPVAIAAVAVAQVVSGLVQAYNSEKARGAAKDKLNQIESLYNQIVPPDYDLSIQDPPALHTEAVQSPKFAASVASPSFDTSAFTPEKLQSVGKLVPQLAPLVKEVAPTLVQYSKDMKTGRQAQLNALDKLTKVGEGGFDPEYAQKIQQAEQKSQQVARASQASLMDSYNRRGVGGSGLELAAQLQGNASAMNNAAMSNQQAATDAYKNQLNALAQGAQLGGQIFGQDQSMQEQNAAIINAFNQRMSSAQQNWEQRNADVMNQAASRNLENEQSIANQNVMNKNQAALADRSRIDDLSKFNYNANVQQQNRTDQLAQQQYQNQLGERGYQNQIAQSLADWKNQQIQQQNQNKQALFNNDMSLNAARSGNLNAAAQMAMQYARDRNEQIQGTTDAVTNAAMYSQSGAGAGQKTYR